MARHDIDIYANDRTGRTLSNIERQLGQINSRGRAVVGTLAGLATGSIARGIINQYRAYERYNTVLRTYLGSQERANSEMQRLQTLANSLPQDLDDITQAFTIFTRTGLDTSSKALTAFSNIATANGKSLTQLGEAVADALTGEFERLKEFGIKVSKENDKFVADIGNGQTIVANTSAELVRRLQQLGEEGGKFGGAAAANADTLNQSLSNLQGAAFTTSVTIGQELAPALKQAADYTASWLNSHQELVKQLSSKLGDALVSGVHGISRALEVLADNFVAIKNAALGLIFVRIASSGATLISRIAQMTSRAKTLSGFFSGAGKAAADAFPLLTKFSNALLVVGRSAGSLAGVAARITGISVAARGLAALGPALANPYVLAAAAIAAAAYGAFKYFEDQTINIAGLQTTVGETIRALWWKLSQLLKGYWADFVNGVGEMVTGLGNYIVQTWQTIKEKAAEYIQPIASAWQWVVNTVKDYTVTLIDNTVGAFVFIGKAIWETVSQIPEFFGAVFRAIGATVNDFAARIVQQFSNIGEGIKLAISGDFAGAFEVATRNAFDGMGATISEEMSAIGKTLPDYGRIAGESFTGGYAEAIGDGLENAALRLSVAGQDLVEGATAVWEDVQTNVMSGFKIVGEGVRGVVEEYRVYNNTVAGATDATAYYDDAILRMSRNQVTATATTNELTEATNRAGAAALTAAQEIAKGLAEEQARYNNLNAALNDTSAIKALSDAYGVSADLITRKLREARNGITDFYEQNMTITDMIRDTWDEMGAGMARGIAEGIMEGKGAFNSFADFLKDFGKRVLTQILEKAIIQPMINQMTNMFTGSTIPVPTLGAQLGMGGGGGGLLGGLFGGGGGLFSGLFGGIGNFFSGLWGGISNFFGGLFGGFFADGGYLPAGKVGIAGEAGPELISGPANITPLNSDTGGALTVNFNIQAIDSQSGTEFILQHKREIEGVIQNAYNRRGKEGIY